MNRGHTGEAILAGDGSKQEFSDLLAGGIMGTVPPGDFAPSGEPAPLLIPQEQAPLVETKEGVKQ